METRARRLRLLLGGLLLVALALRLELIREQHGDLLFEHPVLDEDRYVQTARDLALGGVGERGPYWQPPGIVYALAAITRVAGTGLTAPRVVQALLSTLACLLLFLLGRRLFSERIGLAAAAILALHGVVVYESAELLPATWILFFDLLSLLLLVIAAERKRPAPSLAAGLALGVAAVFAPTVLPFVAVAAVALRRATAIAALLVGVALPIAPVMWHNWTHGHELVLVSTNGGLNFFLGNNPDYAYTFALRPGRRWDDLATEPERRGITSPAAVSGEFMRRGLSFYREHPGRALALLGRKAYLFFDGPEIPRDTDVYDARRGSRVLTLLVWPRWFPDGILIPLALVGAGLVWRERRKLALVYAMLAVQALIAIAFFVTARHRTPSLPLFALFAAAGGATFAQRWRRRQGARRLAPLGAAVALLIALNVPTREGSVSYAAESDFYRGLASLRGLHDPRAAADWFRRASAADPRDARIWFELGNALEALDDGAAAADAWRRAGELDPWDSRARRRLSTVLGRRGDFAGAIAALQANVDARQHEPGHYAPDHLSLALLRARTGQTQQSIDDARAAAAEDPAYCRAQLPNLTRAALALPEITDARFWRTLGDLDRDLGAPDVARLAWDRAAEFNR